MAADRETERMRTEAALALAPGPALVPCSDLHTEQQILGTMDAMKNGSTTPLTNGEVISGLKEALSTGAQRSVNVASVVDGFNKNAAIRIPFPQEAIKVEEHAYGPRPEEARGGLQAHLNRAAEEAAKEAVPVFVDAITSMSIADGFAILKAVRTRNNS